MKKLHLLCRAALSFALLFNTTTTHAQQWRLVEVVNQTDTPATSTSSYLTMDSTRYIYNHTAYGGSSPNNDTINFDEMLVYKRDVNSLLPNEKRTRVYNSSDQLWVTAHYSYVQSTSNWAVQSWDSLFYNGSQLYRMSTFSNLGGNTSESSRDSFAYDANGNVSFKENSISTGVGSPLTPLLWNFYQYDANNNLISDSALLYFSGWWETQYVSKRNFNTAGKLTDYRISASQTGIGGPLELIFRTYNYYNAKGLLSLDSLQTYYSATFSRDHEQRTYTYNSSDQLISTVFWKKDRTNNQTLDSQLITISYTSFGRVAERETVFYNPGGSINQKKKTIYTYEQYFPISVSNIAVNNDNLQLYPVPASNTLNIAWANDKATNLQARIVNTQGQVVQQWTDEISGAYHKTISTDNLPNGNYYLELQAGSEKVHQQFVVVK